MKLLDLKNLEFWGLVLWFDLNQGVLRRILLKIHLSKRLNAQIKLYQLINYIWHFEIDYVYVLHINNILLSSFFNVHYWQWCSFLVQNSWDWWLDIAIITKIKLKPHTAAQTLNFWRHSTTEKSKWNGLLLKFYTNFLKSNSQPIHW